MEATIDYIQWNDKKQLYVIAVLERSKAIFIRQAQLDLIPDLLEHLHLSRLKINFFNVNEPLPWGDVCRTKNTLVREIELIPTKRYTEVRSLYTSSVYKLKNFILCEFNYLLMNGERKLGQEILLLSRFAWDEEEQQALFIGSRADEYDTLYFLPINIKRLAVETEILSFTEKRNKIADARYRETIEDQSRDQNYSQWTLDAFEGDKSNYWNID